MLTQDDIKQKIEEVLNLSIDKASFMRYQRLGLVTASYFLDKRGDNKGRRVGYHPLSLPEFATAMLLVRGDWMKKQSKIRIGRCTLDEIMIGRLLFFKKDGFLSPRGKNKDYELYERNIATGDYKNKIKMTRENMTSLLKEKEAVLKSYMPSDLVKTREQYCYLLYKTVFNEMKEKFAV